MRREVDRLAEQLQSSGVPLLFRVETHLLVRLYDLIMVAWSLNNILYAIIII